MTRIFRLTILLLTAASLSVVLAEPPHRILWSWFADDDLRFINPRETGVGYLAASLHIEGRDRVLSHPRTSPVRIARGTYEIAVIHIDYHRASFTPEQRRLVVAMIAEIAGLTRAPAVQIDFDAPQSAYPFYRDLLRDLRQRLGARIFISITALVSWCESPHSWLSTLQVDEIVPMPFHLGRVTPFLFPGCRGSIGVSLRDAPVFMLTRGQRIYFFPGPQRWSRQSVQAAFEEVKQ